MGQSIIIPTFTILYQEYVIIINKPLNKIQLKSTIYQTRFTIIQ